MAEGFARRYRTLVVAALVAALVLLGSAAYLATRPAPTAPRAGTENVGDPEAARVAALEAHRQNVEPVLAALARRRADLRAALAAGGPLDPAATAYAGEARRARSALVRLTLPSRLRNPAALAANGLEAAASAAEDAAARHPDGAPPAAREKLLRHLASQEARMDSYTRLLSTPIR